MYGPVCTVVWQGAAGDRRPYADHGHIAVPYNMEANPVVPVSDQMGGSHGSAWSDDLGSS